MTNSERDGVMYYAGMLKGICAMLIPEESNTEDATKLIIEKLTDISMDLEMLAKGSDDEAAMNQWLASLKANPGDEATET